MAKHIIDERNGVPYTLVGDYYLPWGDLPDDEPEQRLIGIWGQRHLCYIKQHKRSYYTEMLVSGKLNDYLSDIDTQAEEMFSRIVGQMAETQGVTEQMKAENQMLRARQMNNIQTCAKETILNDLIFI